MGRPPLLSRQELLEKIIQCLWLHGYSATSISQLVQATGVNAASLYAQFGSKKGMMAAAVEAYRQEAVEEMRALLATRSAGREQVSALLEHLLEQSLSDVQRRGCFLVNCTLEGGPDAPEFTEAVRQAMRDLRGVFREALERAPDLLPEVPPAEGAVLLQTQVWALKLLARLGPSREDGQIIIHQTLRALFGMPPSAGTAPCAMLRQTETDGGSHQM